MRISGRSNVVIWLTSKDFGVRSLAATKPAGFRFCAVRLAMPFAKLSDRIDAQNAQIVSHGVWRGASGGLHLLFALPANSDCWRMEIYKRGGTAWANVQSY